MTKEITAYTAGLKVLESYHVKQLFGYPAGSVNSLLDTLHREEKRLHFIQVRHEQVAALAASAHAKLTHNIGVCFGSAGPGAANLINGLYDAKDDHAPVLALIGQVPNNCMNYDYFQEFPESPMFANIAQYNRIVMTPESLPHVIDEAVKHAYANHGVSVVVVPNNFGFAKIPDRHYSSYSPSMDKADPEPKATHKEIQAFLQLVHQAKHPVFHIGRGIHNHGDALIKLSKKLQIPICADGLGLGLVNHHYDGYLGSANRAASKPADEAISTADLIIAIGGDFSFAHTYYASHQFKYVQVDNQRSQLGRHHALDLGIWADAGDFIKKALKASHTQPKSTYFQALVQDKKNWLAYLQQIETARTKNIHTPQLYYWLNQLAPTNTIYSIDTGNNTIDSFRYLNLYQHRWTLSALFATMGYGLPGAISAKLAYPKQQVINLAGDGAAAMVMQDLVTLHKYHIPVLNIVTSNQDLGFIKGEQEDAPMKYFGLHLQDENFAEIAQAMGVKAVTITTPDAIPTALKKGLRAIKQGQPFLIDVKIIDERTLPVEDLRFQKVDHQLKETLAPTFRQDKANHGPYSLRQFFNEYQGKDLRALTTYLKV